MIVIDASVLVAGLLEGGARGEAAAEVLLAPGLVAPELIDIEAVHVARGLRRAGKISEAAATAFVDELGRFAVDRFPHRALLVRMWELRDNLTAYDAAYVALAEALEAPLATADAAFTQAPGIRCAIQLIS
ncbi:putative nucleic acid-binding protein [Marmoricola sp. OAE513]|uniref:type II toxin-antitoxin system VapC family toxin n=1 Tax=Marmoricola sp. OAE513 TaxID=2817894 RepID=UPI001AE1461A